MSTATALAATVPARADTAAPVYDTGLTFNLGLALLRMAVGLTMAAHGVQKLFGWFGGGGISGTGQFFAMSGYPAGKAMAVIAGLSETLGGLGLTVGLLTPLAAGAVIGTLINAIAVKWGGGFFAPNGIEYELLLTLSAASIALAGPGQYALDRFVPGVRAHRISYGIASIVLAVVVAGAVLLARS